MGIKSTVLGFASRTKLAVVQHSPEICMVAGTVELVLTVVSACKATCKFQDALQRHKDRMDFIDGVKKEQADGTATGERKEFNVTAGKIGVWAETMKDVFGCYWKTMILGSGTVVTYLAGYKILNNRLAGVSAVAANLMLQNRELLQRTGDKLGDEAVRKVMGRSDEDAVVETHVDEKTGETVVDSVNYPDVCETFGLWFDAENDSFDKSPTANYELLTQRLAYLEWKKQQDGHLYLNDAIKILGFSDAELFEGGQIYGWKDYKDDKERILHGAAEHIDIGLNKPINADFLKGIDNVCFLTFNVDPEPIVGACGFKKQNDKKLPVRPRRKVVPCTC